ncbi:MAG: acyl-CoA/acyl-ACP dehydrogenase [Marinosulfonomonas sp.]|nr:acyl-CoA/acyl-ACP dehydrogenase [Marinosulfonomonas sp.]
MNISESLAVETSERLLREQCTDTVLAAADAGIWQQALWEQLTEFGLPVALVGEDQGGIDLRIAEAFAIFRLAGQVALPLPIVETVLGNWLLSRAGLEPFEGPVSLVDGTALSLSAKNDGWHLSGGAPRVPWGRRADIVVLVGGKVARVGRKGVTVSEGTNIADEPRDGLAFDAQLENAAVADLPGKTDLMAVLAAARCNQMAGAMERVFELATAYALEREQFGRPLAKFQAIQQNLAVLAEQVAASNAAAEMAAEAVEGEIGRIAVAAAKTRVGEAAGIAASIAHQVVGAMGVTEEFSLHHLTRRLWSWREEYGNETYWAREIGQATAKLGPDALWPAITAV